MIKVMILLANCFIVPKSLKIGCFEVKNDQILFVSVPIFGLFGIRQQYQVIKMIMVLRWQKFFWGSIIANL